MALVAAALAKVDLAALGFIAVENQIVGGSTARPFHRAKVSEACPFPAGPSGSIEKKRRRQSVSLDARS